MKTNTNSLLSILIITAVVSLILGFMGAYFKIKIPEHFAEIMFGLLILASIGSLGWSGARQVILIGQLSAEIAKLKIEVEGLTKALTSLELDDFRNRITTVRLKTPANIADPACQAFPETVDVRQRLERWAFSRNA